MLDLMVIFILLTVDKINILSLNKFTKVVGVQIFRPFESIC